MAIKIEVYLCANIKTIKETNYKGELKYHHVSEQARSQKFFQGGRGLTDNLPRRLVSQNYF